MTNENKERAKVDKALWIIALVTGALLILLGIIPTLGTNISLSLVSICGGIGWINWSFELHKSISKMGDG